MNKMNYVTPQVEMVELEVESAILQMSGEGSNLDYQF